MGDPARLSLDLCRSRSCRATAPSSGARSGSRCGAVGSRSPWFCCPRPRTRFAAVHVQLHQRPVQGASPAEATRLVDRQSNAPLGHGCGDAHPVQPAADPKHMVGGQIIETADFVGPDPVAQRDERRKGRRIVGNPGLVAKGQRLDPGQAGLRHDVIHQQGQNIAKLNDAAEFAILRCENAFHFRLDASSRSASAA